MAPAVYSWLRCTHSSERDSGRCETDETSIASMGLVHGVSIIVAELVDDLRDPIMVIGRQRVSNNVLESKVSIGQSIAQGIFVNCCFRQGSS